MKVAVPPASVAVPSVAGPSLKVTVPVGVLPVTVAVKVTEVPKDEGFEEELRIVVAPT